MVIRICWANFEESNEAKRRILCVNKMFVQWCHTPPVHVRSAFGTQKWIGVSVTSAKHYSINSNLTSVGQNNWVGFDRRYTGNLMNATQKRKRWSPMTQIYLKYKDMGKLESYLLSFVPYVRYGQCKQEFNSLRPGRFQINFRKVIFQLILVIDGWSISCKIVLKWMLMDLTDGKSTLVQVMAWCRQAASHYPSQCWPRSLSPYDVTRPQWVNWFRNNNVYLGKPILEICKSR